MGMDNNCVNLTLRADAECQVVCDGEFFVLLNANQIVKEKAPVGQHILQFISISRPDIQVEKIVDFPDAGKNYLVLVNELAALMKETETKMGVEGNQYVPEPVQCDPEQTTVGEDRKAFEYYEGLVDQGDSSALIKLANCYYKGIGVARNEFNATNYFLRAIDESEVKDDWREAVEGIKNLADQGCSDAQEALGDLYYGEDYGSLIENNIIQEDKELAIDWYKKATKDSINGYLYIKIGNHYYYEDYDAEEAEAWFKRAIQVSGERVGMNELLYLYDNEERVEDAIELCEKYGYSLNSLRCIDIQ